MTPSPPPLPDRQDLRSLVRSLKGRKVAVVGDVMLDVYLRGRVARISPEAPIPVVELTEEDERKAGGAANVAGNVVALGGRSVLVGVVGRDAAGRELAQILKRGGVDASGLVTDPRRPTTEKTRVIAHTQQVVRVDREVKADLPADVAARVVKRALAAVDTCDAVVFEDYNKGVLTPPVIEKVLAHARRKGKPVCVDPKFRNFFAFRGADVVKPNLKEAREAFGIEVAEKSDPSLLAARLRERLSCRAVVLTLGEAGMAVLEGKGPVRLIPAVAREVYDVSGAGDTVAAALALSLAAGAGVLPAATLANYAASIEVTKLGVATVSAAELLARLDEED